jgi:hypothetical protein
MGLHLFPGGDRCTMKRLAVPLAVLLVAVLPATAAADVSFRGESGQDRLVTLRIGDDGLLQRWAIRWRAPCRRPRFVLLSSTSALPPLDLSTRARFVDADGYRAQLRNGQRAIFNVRVAGNRVSARRWRGIFRVRARVFRGGTLVHRCAMRTRWQVRRQG